MGDLLDQAPDIRFSYFGLKKWQVLGNWDLLTIHHDRAFAKTDIACSQILGLPLPRTREHSDLVRLRI